MKTSCIAILALLVIGCESSRQSASLTSEQARFLAMRLANDKASAICHRQPFHAGQPATFESDHWIWSELAPGDIEATVKLAANGSTNSVDIQFLDMLDPISARPWHGRAVWRCARGASSSSLQSNPCPAVFVRSFGARFCFGNRDPGRRRCAPCPGLNFFRPVGAAVVTFGLMRPAPR